jgi:hypothetical protein
MALAKGLAGTTFKPKFRHLLKRPRSRIKENPD